MNNRPEKLTEQEKYLGLQMECAPKSRAADIAVCAVLLVIIFGFALWGVFLPDRVFSEQENRELQQLPSLSSTPDASVMERLKNGTLLDRLINGEFTSDITAYLSDQFPLRDTIVGVKAGTEILIGKKENENVVAAEKGYLVTREDYPSEENLNANLDAIKLFTAAMEKNGIPVYTAVAGRTCDVMLDVLPNGFPSSRRDYIWNALGDFGGIYLIDLLNPLRSAASDPVSDEYGGVYYRTDHHWTTYGAYLAYCEIAKALEITPYPLSDFTVETATKEFYGTAWSSSGMKWIEPDTIYFFRYEGDGDFTTTIRDKNITIEGFYDLDYLGKKDKYSVFLGGTNALTEVSANTGEEREKLLIIKDSFAQSVTPFLCRHFDVILLDVRYYKKSVAEFVAENGIDKVLILNNIASFTDADNYKLLAAGLD